jgi:hypothetical protein
MMLTAVLGAAAGAGIGWLVSRNLSRVTGTCPLMCRPKIAVPYFALLGALLASQYAG